MDALARSAELASYPEPIRVEAAREAVAGLRRRVQEGFAVDMGAAGAFAADIARELSELSLRPAINLSGVVLHTGLGRARLAPSVAAHVAEVAGGHSLVEFDDESGKRGDRQAHVRDLLTKLTGAEDALVVNNAAAGLILSLRALAQDRDVVLSRGQMVEIGGSFRVPDIVRESGCHLVEIGCTNKTRLSDYEAAIGETTGALLICHRSNFKIVGFTEEPTRGELAKLARAREVYLVDDMGTGCLADLSRYGLPKAWTFADSVASGVDIAIGSGDKLLGGPQAGIVVGKADLIEKIRKHPMARAVRVDKLTLAALQATLQLYAEGRESSIPTLRYIGRSADEVKVLARRLARGIGAPAKVESGFSAIGGGSEPGTELPTWRVGLIGIEPSALAYRLRKATPAVVGQIERDTLWLDPRTAEGAEIKRAGEIVRRCLS